MGVSNIAVNNRPYIDVNRAMQSNPGNLTSALDLRLVSAFQSPLSNLAEGSKPLWQLGTFGDGAIGPPIENFSWSAPGKLSN